MKHTIHLTRWDVIVGALFTTTVFSPLILVLQVMFSAYVTFGTSEWTHDVQSTAEIAFIGGAMMLMFITLVNAFTFFFSVLYVLTNPKLKYGVLGDHVLELREDGLFESTAFNESLHKWQSVTKVRRLFGRHFIFISGTQYQQVPDRSFPSKREAIAFADAVRSRILK